MSRSEKPPARQDNRYCQETPGSRRKLRGLSVNECAGREMCILTNSANVSDEEKPTLCEEAGKFFSQTVV